MMLHPRKLTWKHGSHFKKNTKNLFPVPIVQIINPELLKSVVELKNNSTRQRNMFIVLTVLYVLLQEHSVVFLKIIKRKMYPPPFEYSGLTGNKGVNVPEVLQSYLGGLKFIPYTRDLPKNTTSQKRGVPTKTKSAREIAKGAAAAATVDGVPAKELVEKTAELNLAK